MRKLKIIAIFCLTLIIIGFGWVYSKNYRLAYEFGQNRGSYETIAKFMFDNGVIDFDRRPCIMLVGAFSSSIFSTEPCPSLRYSADNGAFDRDCDKFCNLGNGITVDNLMIQMRVYDIHSKHYDTPFDSLFFGVFDWDRTIAYKKDGWGNIQKGQTIKDGGTFEYRIDDNWIILKNYDRIFNPLPIKYDY